MNEEAWDTKAMAKQAHSRQRERERERVDEILLSMHG